MSDDDDDDGEFYTKKFIPSPFLTLFLASRRRVRFVLQSNLRKASASYKKALKSLSFTFRRRESEKRLNESITDDE